MKKVKILNDYGYILQPIKDDKFETREIQPTESDYEDVPTIDEQGNEIVEKQLKSDYVPQYEKVLVQKGDYTLVDPADLAEIGKTKKFYHDTEFGEWLVVDMSEQEISDIEQKHEAAKLASELQRQAAENERLREIERKEIIDEILDGGVTDMAGALKVLGVI